MVDGLKGFYIKQASFSGFQRIDIDAPGISRVIVVIPRLKNRFSFRILQDYPSLRRLTGMDSAGHFKQAGIPCKQ